MDTTTTNSSLVSLLRCENFNSLHCCGTNNKTLNAQNKIRTKTGLFLLYLKFCHSKYTKPIWEVYFFFNDHDEIKFTWDINSQLYILWFCTNKPPLKISTFIVQSIVRIKVILIYYYLYFTPSTSSSIWSVFTCSKLNLLL